MASVTLEEFVRQLSELKVRDEEVFTFDYTPPWDIDAAVTKMLMEVAPKKDYTINVNFARGTMKVRCITDRTDPKNVQFA